MGKKGDNGNISIFTKKGVTFQKEEDVPITCKGAPIIIVKQDERGQYRIPLVQECVQWQPRHPTPQAGSLIRDSNNLYDLPSIEQEIK